MSEESNVVVSSTEKDENLETESGALKEDDDPTPVLHSDESSADTAEVFAEQVHIQENRQPIEPANPEENVPVALGGVERNVETDSSTTKQQLIATDASTETESMEKTGGIDQSAVKPTTVDASSKTKCLEKTSDGDQPAVKSITVDASTKTKCLEKTSDGDQPTVKSNTVDGSTETKSSEDGDFHQPAVKSSESSEIAPSRAPSTDEGLEGVTENIQVIFEGMKDLKISTKDLSVTASGKKGRKPPSTPRAKSTPVKLLTSPPLTRSRSRDLQKFPSTPSSPKRLTSKKTNEADLDEVKEARGRQRVKKN